MARVGMVHVLHNGLCIDASDDDSARSMQRILDDKSNFTDMCRDLLISIPEDLKD